MSHLRKIITEYRHTKDASILENFKFINNGKTGYGENFDLNYWNRKDLIFELFKNYDLTDKPLIKWLLTEEIKGFETAIPVYTTDLCAFMLYKHMELEDVYTLFDAKFGAGTDLQCYVDIELVFGFDRNETKEYLKNKQKDKRKNKRIVKVIESYEKNPNGKYKSREQYIQYFETRKINIINNDMAATEEYSRV